MQTGVDFTFHESMLPQKHHSEDGISTSPAVGPNLTGKTVPVCHRNEINSIVYFILLTENCKNRS